MTPELIKQWAAAEGGLHEVLDDAYQERGDWLPYVAHFAALVAAHQRELDAQSAAWPADLSSNQRTQSARFGVCDNLAIDDDDFRFDALIVVHGDFGDGEKAKYVAEVCRRLNGFAAAIRGRTG